MEYIGDTKTTHEELEGLMVEWVNEGKLEKYMKNKYSKWLVSFRGNFAEVFIDDDEADNYDEDRFGYEDAFYIVDSMLKENSIDLDGEPLSWATDRMSEGTLQVYALSELSPYVDNNFEFGTDGNILYVACDDETKKEILSTKN